MGQGRQGRERAACRTEGDDETSLSVSIGMPVFNGAAFLARALDSVLAQTYTDFELIISDNASTDATPEILRHYAARDARIRHFRQAKNIGLGNNHTFVAKQARGRFCKWVCPDDELAPTLVADCVKVLQDIPDVVRWDRQWRRASRPVRRWRSRTAPVPSGRRLLPTFDGRWSTWPWCGVCRAAAAQRSSARGRRCTAQPGSRGRRVALSVVAYSTLL